MHKQAFSPHADQERKYTFILFVVDNETNSMLAKKNLADLCEHELKGRAEIRIVDVMKDFDTAAAHNILLTPTLLIKDADQETMVIGNLSNRKKVRAALHLPGE